MFCVFAVIGTAKTSHTQSLVSAVVCQVCDHSLSHCTVSSRFYAFNTIFGNSLDNLRHTRSVAYSVELVLLNKFQISGGRVYPDCYQIFDFFL